MRLGLVLLIALQAICSAKQCDQGCSSCETPRYLPLRDCPKFGYDCGKTQDSDGAFNVTTSPSTGCARLSCADPRARLFVDGRAYAMLRCRDWRWQLGRRACDSSSHALCAKPCTYCSTAVPSYLPAGKFSKPLIKLPSATRQCATASCGADSFLYGVGARGVVIDRIWEDELACTGDARWRDSNGAEYDYAVCGGETSICQNCKDLTNYATARYYTFEVVGNPLRTNGRACSRYRCSDGEVFVLMIVVEIGDLTCSFDGNWKINGIKVDAAAKVACVKSSTACSLKLDAPLSKFQRPDLITGSYKYQHGPLVAKPCPGSGTFYFLENESNTTFGTAVDTGGATCHAKTGKWIVGGKYYYQIACAKRDCTGCATITSATKPEIDNSLSGFKYASLASKKDYSACTYYACTGNELAIIDKYGARKAKSLTCGRDGTWLINGIRPASQPTKVACVSDCSSCNKAVTTDTLLPPDFAIIAPNPCLIALACPKGKFFGKVTSNAPYTELAAGHPAECGIDGKWNFQGASYNSIGCSKRGVDCTGSCNASPQQITGSPIPGFYNPGDVYKQEVERYDELFQTQSCRAYECPPSFSLVLQTFTDITFIAKRLKCEMNDLWFDNQDPSAEIKYASCMIMDGNCKRNFPVISANYSEAIIQMGNDFHMAVNKCPGSSKYYYLKEKWATPTETATEPRCRGGLWQVDRINAEFIGCKAGCPALKTLTCPSGMGETENGPVKEELSNRCLPADDPESTQREWSKRESYYTCAFEHSDACVQAPKQGYGIPVQIKTVAVTKKTIASCSAGFELRAKNYGAMGSEAFCVFVMAMNGHKWVNSELKFTDQLMCIKV